MQWGEYYDGFIDGTHYWAAGIAEPTIEEILTCLREFFGVVA